MCGWLPADATADVQADQQREHVFWLCPCAQAVVSVLSRNLCVQVPILPVHVWLLLPPCPEVHEQVWWAVCLCTLNAMLRAHKQRLSLDRLQEHTRKFIAEGLADFLACQGHSSSLGSALTQDHPFVGADVCNNLFIHHLS